MSPLHTCSAQTPNGGAYKDQVFSHLYSKDYTACVAKNIEQTFAILQLICEAIICVSQVRNE